MNNNLTWRARFKKSGKDKEVRRSEFVIAIVVNIILLYIFNNLLNWHISFIASSFQNVLWIINLSIGFNIIFNVLFIFYQPEWFRDSLQIILNILGFLVVYFLYTVFPFNFNQILISYGLKFALILIMLGIVVGTVYQILKLIFK